MKSSYIRLFFPFIFLSATCNGVRKDVSNAEPGNTHNAPNHLIHESSPYLLQHSHNPVDWYPWGEEALQKAKRENKLLIISIGYSACHWCHVMENECFEDFSVARLMNEKFVCIKVDREERPDIDQVYMEAVQLLTGRGGWPLNAIALADGRPIHGGTYFPKNEWISVLNEVFDFVKKYPDKAEKQATLLTQGIQTSELVSSEKSIPSFAISDLETLFDNWQTRFDFINGGLKGAPKFPMPGGHQFLLHYHHLTGSQEALQAATVALDQMASGGIYDHIGGGFHRYATDDKWRIPHFEKMLYDNAQLVSLYSSAYQDSKNEHYKNVVFETLEFISREMTADNGEFYSSLDADSEGEEGKYYVWSQNELRNEVGTNAQLEEYWHVTTIGNWENGNNILYADPNQQFDDLRIRLGVDEFQKLLINTKATLLAVRERRVHPVRDEKVLTSWNGLMCKAYVDAYRTFDEEAYLKSAVKNAEFILQEMKSSDHRLNRNFMNGNSSINGFLDDYAFTIEAFIALYQATFEERWLYEAKHLLEYSVTHFSDENSGMFFYTSDLNAALIARKMEIADNVIPSSNSAMAKNLFVLGHYFSNDGYIARSKQMLNNIKESAMTGGVYYSNWDVLMAWFATEPYEVAIVGENFKSLLTEFNQHYLPTVFLCGGCVDSTLPLLENKLVQGQTTIYVCRNKTCKMPVTEVKDALIQLTK